MKKVLLSLFLMSSLGAIAQSSFELTVPTTYIGGTTNVVLQSHAYVKNIGSGSVDVKVSRTVNTLSPNHTSNFCFNGACYPPATSITPQAVTMNPGDTINSFLGDLNPNSTSGISYVTYCFYDVNNPSDSVCVTYTYNAGAVGIQDLFAGNKFLSNAVPNPADDKTTIATNLSIVKDARIVISNVLGSVVKNITVTDRQASVNVNTEDLKDGVYYYTLYNDGKSIGSKKLIVKH